MEPAAPKSLERIISQRAFQMSSSFPCKICVLGFFCGVCFTYLLLVALSPYQNIMLGLAYSSSASGSYEDSSLMNSSKDLDRNMNCSSPQKDLMASEKLQLNGELNHKNIVLLLYSLWSAALNEAKDDGGETSRKVLKTTSAPKAPHLEDCKLSVEINKQFDKHGENGSFPPWILWKGLLGLKLHQPETTWREERMHQEYRKNSHGAYPPWIAGSDEDNFPLTRKAQRDIWIHQHPQNCNDSRLRFIVADWEKIPGFGFGAQLVGMAGLLAIAINENRILVTQHYNRADHDGCRGSSRSHWSCYFFPETSAECQDRAFDLMMSQEAWTNGTVTLKENYTSKEIWAGKVPRLWGEPWGYLQPTTEVDGGLLTRHRKMDRRWWRAQAVRYLMRFQSEYTCDLLNVARNTAFGLQAAEMVHRDLPASWTKEVGNRSLTDIEKYVWSNNKPWIPRPLLSLHVRMGDKACEMKVFEFEDYMNLANRIRKRFPELNYIWLSTEMQEVIDKTRSYPYWKFYYTNVTRQVGNNTMAAYEASLGRETSTNYPLVNFIMASEADFFVGALGSTWCFLIDGMRNTGGKVMAGYLSVNKDRFW